MKQIKAAYLVLFKGYSVVRFSSYFCQGNELEYGACDSSMEFDYGHDGNWGSGKTPTEAVLDCYRKSNAL